MRVLEQLAMAAHSASKSDTRWEHMALPQRAYWIRVAEAVISKDRELAGTTDHMGINRQARMNARKRRGGMAGKLASESLRG